MLRNRPTVAAVIVWVVVPAVTICVYAYLSGRAT